MKKIVIAASAVILVAVAAVGFYACKKETFSKEGTVKSHVLTSYYDQDLLNHFMDEPLVEEFHQAISACDVSVLNGILKFKDLEAFNKVYELLIKYSELYDDHLAADPTYAVYDNSNKFPDMPILYAFEVYKDFFSLRGKIEREILGLEHGDGIPEKGGDPDDIFIVSDYERTLLSPDCEIIIGNTIFLYGKDQNLMIINLNFENLETVKSLWVQYGETEGTVKAFQQHLAYQNDFYKGGEGNEGGCPDCSTLTINRQVNPMGGSCPRTYTFQAYYNGSLISKVIANPNPTDCDVTSIHWDFGDNTTSSAYEPTHTYSQGGWYTVQCKIILANGQTCTTEIVRMEVKDCGIDISQFTKDANYQEDNGAMYIITTTTKHCNGLTPTQYTWTISPNGGTYTTSTGRLEHLFSIDGAYTVTVSANFSDGCSSSATRKETIKGTGNCCKNFSGDKMIEYYPATGYKLKHKFATRNVWPFHRIVVKNVHYQKKSNGKYKRDKATTLYASFEGLIAKKDYANNYSINNSCPNQYHIYPNGGTNHKKKALNYDYGVGYPFRVAKEMLHSKYSVQSTNNGTSFNNYDALKLHNKSCQ